MSRLERALDGEDCWFGQWCNGDLTIDDLWRIKQARRHGVTYLYILFRLPHLGGGWTPLECIGTPVPIEAYSAERAKELDLLLHGPAGAA